jgi:carbamoyltransferase
MGLAPYGKPVYRDLILQHLIDVKSDGTFWLNMEYFDYAVGDAMTTEKFSALFGGPRREPEALLTQREFDLAASIQDVLESVVMLLAQTLRKETGLKHLCLAGGVALNCVANGKLAKSGVFDAIWAQPASGDSGGALGAAYTGWFADPKNTRRTKASDLMQGGYLGSEFAEGEVKAQLDGLSANYRRLQDDELAPTVARLLAGGNVIGWFQGRMEYGPRSLGARSILGDARSPEMQSTMNLKIKNRESFRPFAPAVLADKAAQWFDMEAASPYMLFVYPVQERRRVATRPDDEAKNGIEKLKVQRSTIPAVTHVDHSARVQTVCGEFNPRFRDLIEAFDRETGCPVIVNTSFNVRGEPIVESPTDAYTCFMRTAMDYLVVGNYLIAKTDQPAWQEKIDWREHFALD